MSCTTPTDGDPHLRVELPSTQSADVALTRLRPSRSYRYQALGTTASGTFMSDTVPSDLLASLTTPTGQRTVPLVLLHLYQPNGFIGYAIIDEHNDVVWYWRTSGFPYGVTRRANGNFVLLDGGRGLVEVGPSGTVVHELAQDLVNRELHHDVIASPSNTLFVIAFDDRVVNGATVRGDAIWEWNPESGAMDRRWTAWDFFTLGHTQPFSGKEWMHANALAIGPRHAHADHVSRRAAHFRRRRSGGALIGGGSAAHRPPPTQWCYIRRCSAVGGSMPFNRM